MNTFVVIRDMSAGNESVGEMWQETKVFDGSATLREVALWAMDGSYGQSGESRRRITITKPHEDSQP